MTMAVVLRTDQSKNIFRDVILATLASPYVDKAVLCSGFFQENFKGSQYRVSEEKSLSKVCAGSGVSLVTVGIHNSTWKKDYMRFKNSMVADGVRITCLYKPGMRWHAKVFIGSMNGVPNIGIVGSSNMTRNAFSIGPNGNKECDVFMWDRRSPIANLVADLGDVVGDQILIRAPYIPRLNGGLSLAKMLARIQSEILDGGLQEL